MRAARSRRLGSVLTALAIGLAAAAVACGAGEAERTLLIAGIPDQNATHLERQFDLLAKYLEEETGIEVRYVPSNDYAAIVSGFQRGDIQLAWFGGLTGVQARLAVPGAEAIAQRPSDAEFHSVFNVHSDVAAETLAELRGLTFTFGSPSSTSGHLMPRFFLQQAGIDPDVDFEGVPGFSGSHDRTYALVESGAFQAGALNEAVWDQAVRDGDVDTTRVIELLRTPPYFDYNFTIRPDVDARLGEGTHASIVQALLDLDPDASPEAAELLALFQTTGFIASSNQNYDAIEDVARAAGILR